MAEEKPKQDPLQTGGTYKRSIDRLTNESLPLLERSWVFVSRSRVKTWQGLFLLAFISGAFVSFVWSVSLEIESLSKASGTATLSMTSPDASGDGSTINAVQDGTFSVDLVVDTGGVDVVATRAIVTYDPADFQLTGWDTSNSIFGVNNSCVYQGNPCQIVDNDTAGGTLSLTLAKPSPGVRNNAGLLATLTFKALRSVSTPSNNIRYTFVGPDNATDSDVIEDGGSGNDLLSSVSGIRALVGAPACTDYTYSTWGTCQSNGTQTRTVVSSVPDVCSGGATPVTTQPCTYTPPTCTSFTESGWGACQPDGTQTQTVTGIPAGCTGGNPPASTQSCTYTGGGTTCTSFTTSSWGACQVDNTQVRAVTGVPAGCSGGNPPASSQPCTYVPPTVSCTDFSYGEWGACVGGKQSRDSVGSPAGCSGGNPNIEQSCTVDTSSKGNGEFSRDPIKVIGEKARFSKREKFMTDDSKLTFKGSDADIKNGKVEIYREGKLKDSTKVSSSGDWSIKVTERENGTFRYAVRYLDASGNEVDKSASYSILVDDKDPEITDLPLILSKARGEKVWWDAKDNEDIDYYRYEFLGLWKTTKSKSFNIPANTPTGLHVFQLKVYDEVGNITSKSVLIRVR